MKMEKLQAFPSGSDNGMNMLEYYAGLAMQGVLSDSNIMQLIREKSGLPGHRRTENLVAGLAVEYARALIAELEKEQGQ